MPRALQVAPDDRQNVDYGRVSLDDQETGEGVDSQHDDCAEFNDEIGLPLDATYQDNSISAFSGRERPDFERLLADVVRGVIASVTVWHADRFTRDVEEALRIIKLFREHKVRLFSVQKGGEYLLTRASGRAEFIDDINQAQKESGHKGERVSLARKRQARKGQHGGGIRRYGWGVPTGRVRSKCVNPKAPLDERVYVDVPVLDMTKHREDEAEEIRRWARELFATKGNMAQLLAGIRARSVLTVSQSDGRTLKRGGKAVDHGGWNVKTIRRILLSPRVSGHTVHNGEIVKRDAWPAILPEDVRQALIVLLDDPARVSTPGNTPRWLISKSPHALCGQCTLDGMVTVRHNSKGPVYRCNACNKGNQLAPLVDEYVAAVACERLSRPDLVQLVMPPRPAVDVAALREEITLLEQTKTEAALAYARRSIDLGMLETVKAESDRQITVARDKLNAAIPQGPLSDFLETDSFEAAAAVWEAKSVGERREIVRLLMRVVLLKGDPYQLDPSTVIITPVKPTSAVSRAGRDGEPVDSQSGRTAAEVPASRSEVNVSSAAATAR
ncbi:recombinase family protein [Streptomyces sp. NPDC051014]|uniref:recombinase family protein n=1 Tax=Streptomyces sp. NPDC051014 TaxID=3155751 RepID=UPI0033D15859